MSLFKTPTPAYRGQGGTRPASEPEWLQWLKQLFKTPTPEYRRAPAPAVKPAERHDDSR